MHHSPTFSSHYRELNSALDHCLLIYVAVLRWWQHDSGDSDVTAWVERPGPAWFTSRQAVVSEDIHRLHSLSMESINNCSLIIASRRRLLWHQANPWLSCSCSRSFELTSNSLKDIQLDTSSRVFTCRSWHFTDWNYINHAPSTPLAGLIHETFSWYLWRFAVQRVKELLGQCAWHWALQLDITLW